MIRSALTAVLMWPVLATLAVAQPVCTGRERFEGPAPHAAPRPADYPGPALFSHAAFQADTVEALAAALDRAVAATRPQSIAVAVWRPGQGVWSARHEAEDVAPRPLHWWASAGKIVTSVAILQLMEEGRLSLGDPLTRWRDDVPNGRWITIDQLLDHTSGLFSANEDAAWRAAPRAMTLDDELAIAARNGALFCPGQAWRYSNTGYSILGSIVEAADGRPYAEAATARTLARLGLDDARMLTPSDGLEDVQPLGAPPAGEPPIDPRWPGPAGGIVATPQAMIRLLHGALSGGLLEADSLSLMLERPHPMFGQPMFYGRGLMLYDVPTGTGGSLYWIGHSGGAPGVKALVVWSPGDQAYVAVALTGEGSAEATANLLLAALGSH